MWYWWIHDTYIIIMAGALGRGWVDRVFESFEWLTAGIIRSSGETLMSFEAGIEGHVIYEFVLCSVGYSFFLLGSPSCRRELIIN